MANQRLESAAQVQEWRAREFEATQLFSPSTPVSESDLFAGRRQQLDKMFGATGERGKHVVLYGERGVGKTSLAKVFTSLFPSTLRHIFAIREQVDPSDNFTSIWRKVFKDLEVKANRNGEELAVPLASFYEDEITPDDIRREFEVLFKPNDIPVIVIDEFDKAEDPRIQELMANTIKSLSDYGVNCTVVIVGVADNVNTLIGEHPSVARCIEQIIMPRMQGDEARDILNRIIPKLGMNISDKATNEIVVLASGLPAYVHALGLYSTRNAIAKRNLHINLEDVRGAVHTVLERSQESIQDQYAKAIHSNRGDSLYKEVLLACAQAETDDRGSFTPLSVCDPLSRILGREVQIANFQQHLLKFISEERAHVLVRRGRERAYRFRFRDPMMQPFVIMKGREQGLIGKRTE